MHYGSHLNVKEATIIRAFKRRSNSCRSDTDILIDVFWHYNDTLTREKLSAVIIETIQEWENTLLLFDNKLELIKGTGLMRGFRIINL